MQTWRPDEWAKERARGKRDFLLRYGFLRRGLPFGVLVALVIEAALGSTFPDAFRSPLFLVRGVAFIALFTLTGCMRAHVTWNAHEKRFG